MVVLITGLDVCHVFELKSNFTDSTVLKTVETSHIYNNYEETNAKNTLQSYFVHISNKVILNFTTTLNCKNFFWSTVRLRLHYYKLFHTDQNHMIIPEIFLQCCIQKHFSCSLIPTTFVSEVKMEFFTKESFLSFFLESSHITEHNETNTKDLDNSEQTKNSWIFFCLCVC